MAFKRFIIASFALILLTSCAGRKGPVPGDPVRRVVTHKVAKGESWESIAGDYYGDRARADYLAVYNGYASEDKPEPGSGIRIPLTEDDLEDIKDGEEAVRMYNRGLEMVNDGDYAGAVERFREALKIDSSLRDAAFNLAVTYQRLGLHENAVTVLEDLVVREGTEPEYLFALGNSYFHWGKHIKAGRCFRDVLKADPGHLKAIYSLAIVYEKTGNDSDAARMWERYIELDPDSEWGRMARSHLADLRRPDRGRN